MVLYIQICVSAVSLLYIAFLFTFLTQFEFVHELHITVIRPTLWPLKWPAYINCYTVNFYHIPQIIYRGTTSAVSWLSRRTHFFFSVFVLCVDFDVSIITMRVVVAFENENRMKLNFQLLKLRIKMCLFIGCSLQFTPSISSFVCQNGNSVQQPQVGCTIIFGLDSTAISNWNNMIENCLFL